MRSFLSVNANRSSRQRSFSPSQHVTRHSLRVRNRSRTWPGTDPCDVPRTSAPGFRTATCAGALGDAWGASYCVCCAAGRAAVHARRAGWPTGTDRPPDRKPENGEAAGCRCLVGRAFPLPGSVPATAVPMLRPAIPQVRGDERMVRGAVPVDSKCRLRQAILRQPHSTPLHTPGVGNSTGTPAAERGRCWTSRHRSVYILCIASGAA